MLRRIEPATRVAAVLGVAVVLAVASTAATPAASAAGGTPALRLAQATTAPPPAAPEQQFAQLKARLAITPAQETTFNAFAAVMRQNISARSAFLRRNPPGRRRSAIEELRVQSEAAELDARGLQRLLPVFQALYASLSEPQKRIADQVFVAPPAAGEAPGR
ncbi:MAG TPA: Spy/CpxP family protein refolding chaperone [Stellaceae bacterium]|nr:Spy/CpxP family protein refolding chaperone [Stellaceae bacterium]